MTPAAVAVPRPRLRAGSAPGTTTWLMLVVAALAALVGAGADVPARTAAASAGVTVRTAAAAVAQPAARLRGASRERPRSSAGTLPFPARLLTGGPGRGAASMRGAGRSTGAWAPADRAAEEQRGHGDGPQGFARADTTPLAGPRGAGVRAGHSVGPTGELPGGGGRAPPVGTGT